MEDVYVIPDHCNALMSHFFAYTLPYLKKIPPGSNFTIIHTKFDINDPKFSFVKQTLNLINTYNFVEDATGYNSIIMREDVTAVADVDFKFIRELLPSEKCNLTDSKVYISRNKFLNTHVWESKVRNIINEDEMYENILKPLGFNKVYLEDLNMLDKLILARTSKVIISSPGSQLIFLSIFANENTKIIEFDHDVTFYIHVRTACEKLNILYYNYSKISKIDPFTGTISELPMLMHYNIVVNDLDNLREFIKKII